MKRFAMALGMLLVTSSACGDDDRVGGAMDGSLPDAEPIADASEQDTSAGGDDGGTDAWVEPDAGGPEPCGEEGATRIAMCGHCGMQSQRCGASGTWENVGECLYQGECAAGAVETRSTDRCGEETRLCDAMCHWLAWSTVTPDAECVAGEERTVADSTCGAGFARQRCSASCAWTATGVCVDECGDMPRTSPVLSTEICIPAGMFVRGDSLFASATPIADVYVSAFYIDKFPVTNERYRACMAAGACTTPAGSLGDIITDDTQLRRPVLSLHWQQAVDFCAWDGGRRLPTSAEWEKAARGPSPRSQPYTWDGPTYRCDLLYAEPCGYSAPYSPSGFRLPDDVDGLPGTVSYYGVQMLIGGVHEWTHDYYDPMYYADPSSMIDPQGPATGTARVMRGALRDFSGLTQSDYRVGRIWPGGLGGAAEGARSGLRCARTAPGSP